MIQVAVSPNELTLLQLLGLRCSACSCRSCQLHPADEGAGCYALSYHGLLRKGDDATIAEGCVVGRST